MTPEVSVEQHIRNILEALGDEDVQSASAGELIDGTNYLNELLSQGKKAAQAEQRQRIIAIIKGGDRPWQELVDAILKQEDE